MADNSEKRNTFSFPGSSSKVSVHPDDDITKELSKLQKLTFEIDSIPPLHISAVYAFQQLIDTIPGCVTAIMTISTYLCATKSPEFAHIIASLMSSTIFMAGLATILQICIGVRLPIIQGSAFAFLPPIVAMMSVEKWKCVDLTAPGINNVTMETEERIIARIADLSGGFILASCFQVLLGSLGGVGLMLRYIGPLTIVPTVSLVGLSMTHVATASCETSWIVSMLGMLIIYAISTVMKGVLLPLPAYNSQQGIHLQWYPLLQLFSPLISVSLTWLLCYVFTVTDYFPNDVNSINYPARTDNSWKVIYDAHWFYVPYPGQFGWPTFGAGAFVGFLAATFSSIIESIGDYYAAAKICNVPPPPRHSMNRGIASEGFASIIGGFLGVCHGTISYSSLLGFIGVTGNASRRTWQMIGFYLMACGLFGKLGAFLTIIPTPIIGSNIIAGLGMVVSLAFTNIIHIDMSLSRNQLILGTSMMLGLMVPQWSIANPDAINTGNTEFDQVLLVLCRTSMFVGGIVGFILDNTMPGDHKIRGLIGINSTEGNFSRGQEVYDVMGIGKFFEDKDSGWLKWLPFLPMYDQKPSSLEDAVQQYEDEDNMTESADDSIVVPEAVTVSNTRF